MAPFSSNIIQAEHRVIFEEGYQIGYLHQHQQQRFLATATLADMRRVKFKQEYNHLFNTPPWLISSSAKNL